MRKDESWAREWALEGGHEQEMGLLDRLLDLGPAFEDMLFAPGSASARLVECQSWPAGSDGWVDDVVGLPDELEYFTYLWFRPRVEPLRDECLGYFDAANQVICISPDRVGDDSVVLHEMIHLHEFVVNELPMYFHDALFWSLYQGLRPKVPELDAIIGDHAHVLTGSQLHSLGGTHDILFLLKSFDLDIGRGWPLGTVFGYGRDDEFGRYGYVA